MKTSKIKLVIGTIGIVALTAACAVDSGAPAQGGQGEQTTASELMIDFGDSQAFAERDAQGVSHVTLKVDGTVGAAMSWNPAANQGVVAVGEVNVPLEGRLIQDDSLQGLAKSTHSAWLAAQNPNASAPEVPYAEACGSCQNRSTCVICYCQEAYDECEGGWFSKCSNWLGFMTICVATAL